MLLAEPVGGLFRQEGGGSEDEFEGVDFLQLLLQCLERVNGKGGRRDLQPRPGPDGLLEIGSQKVVDVVDDHHGADPLLA